MRRSGLAAMEANAVVSIELITSDPDQSLRNYRIARSLLALENAPPSGGTEVDRMFEAPSRRHATRPEKGVETGEQDNVLFRLTTRAQLLFLMRSIYRLRDALISYAERHKEDCALRLRTEDAATLCASGSWALMFDTALSRDSERTVALFQRINRSTAGFDCQLPLQRLRIAELLGFEGLADNVHDALFSRDAEMEFSAVLMMLSQTLARLCDDLSRHADCFPGSTDFAALQSLTTRFRGMAATTFAALSQITISERGPSGKPAAPQTHNRRALSDIAEAAIQDLPILATLLDETRSYGEVGREGTTPTEKGWTGTCGNTAPCAARESMNRDLVSASARIRLGRKRLADREDSLTDAQNRLREAAHMFAGVSSTTTLA